MVEMHFDKSISVSGSYKGDSGGRAPGRCGDFTAFFLKNYEFLDIFWPKFRLKNLFF